MTHETVRDDARPGSPPASHEGAPKVAPRRAEETSSLERRVLAHERILQALIAHMAEAEPKFLDRLAEMFSDPIGNARSEHPHVSTAAYADAFIAAIFRLGESPARDRPLREAPAQPGPDSEHADVPEIALRRERPAPSARVAVRNRSGVWEVRLDGAFFGDYTRENQALEASNSLVRLMTESEVR